MELYYMLSFEDFIKTCNKWELDFDDLEISFDFQFLGENVDMFNYKSSIRKIYDDFSNMFTSKEIIMLTQFIYTYRWNPQRYKYDAGQANFEMSCIANYLIKQSTINVF